MRLALFHPRTARRRLAWWLLGISIAIHVPIGVRAFQRSRLYEADFENYYDIGTRPGRPYVDFPVEFPVGTVQLLRALAPSVGSRERFGYSLVALNLVANVAIAGALGCGWGIEAAAAYAITVVPILDMYLLRLDLCSTAFATVGVAAWRRDRTAVAAIALVAGAAFKLWPLVFMPLLLAPPRGRIRGAPIATAFATGMVVLGDWLWVAGPQGLYQVLTFRGARGWELESSVGAVWMLVDRSSMRLEQGAWRIGTSTGAISVLLFALGAIPCLWMIWRGARTRHLGAGWTGGLSALLLMSALLSPQFSAWFAPAAGVAWAEKDKRTAVFTAVAVFLTNLVWKSFVPLLHGTVRALLTLHSRNLFLLFVAIYAGRLLFWAPLAPVLAPSSAGDQTTA